MEIDLPKHIRRTDREVRYVMDTVADRVCLLLCWSLSIGAAVWSLVLPVVALWAVLLAAMAILMWTSMGLSLVCGSEELIVERRGKEQGRVMWSKIAMVRWGWTLGQVTCEFFDREGKLMGRIRTLDNPHNGDWHALLSAYLPEDTIWRRPGGFSHPTTRRVARARAGIGLAVGIIALTFAWPLVTLPIADPIAWKFKAFLLLAALIALGYGLLFGSDAKWHSGENARPEWIDKQIDVNAAVDFIRFATGRRVGPPQTYAYRATLRAYEVKRDRLENIIGFAYIAAFLSVCLFGMYRENSPADALLWLAALCAGVLSLIATVLITYLGRMKELSQGLDDHIELSDTRIVLISNGRRPVQRCSWPRWTPGNKHVTGPGKTIVTLIADGTPHKYDLLGMECIDPERVENLRTERPEV